MAVTKIQHEVDTHCPKRHQHSRLLRLARRLPVAQLTKLPRPPPHPQRSRHHLQRYYALPTRPRPFPLTHLPVPTNLKTQDAFHLTIEEYLLALTELTSDLARLATNAVTLGDFSLPLTISAFVKDLFAGFQLLNLKNDILRKRADGVKYDVKRVEDVVYDLSLRGLVKRPADAENEGQADADTEMPAAISS